MLTNIMQWESITKQKKISINDDENFARYIGVAYDVQYLQLDKQFSLIVVDTSSDIVHRQPARPGHQGVKPQSDLSYN